MCSAIQTIGVSLCLFLFAEFTCLRADSLQKTSRRGDVLDQFKVSREHDTLLVPVNVKGKKYLFLLDTGTSISIYDKSFRSILGDALRADNISFKFHTHLGDKEGLSLFRPPPAKMGNIGLPTDRPVLCIDLAKWRKVTKEEIYGIIGMDYLQEHVFKIDFDRGEVTFLRSVGTDSGTRIPASLINSVPHVEASVPGSQMRETFMVDTGYLGNNSGSLREAVFDTLVQRSFLSVTGNSKFESFLGSGSVQEGHVKEASLGKFCHNNLLFSKSKLSSFSLNYLSRYLVTFDFRNKALYLKKGRHFDKVDLQDMSGLHVFWEEGKVLVESVDDASPAARAGIKRRDVLLRIDDVRASEISLTRTRRLFCERDRKYRLLIQRGEGKMELTLDLRGDRKTGERKE